MSTQTIIRGDATTFLIDDDREIKLFVIYASSQKVGIDGLPIQQIPLDLVEDDADGGAVARAMIKAGDLYTDANGWIIEHVNADVVPADDMARLAKRLASTNEVWDEFICLPEGVCTTCGGTGFLTMDDGSDEDERYELRNGCERCSGTGKL